MVEDSNVKIFQPCKMVGILTAAAQFCWTNVQKQWEYIKLIFKGLFWYATPLPLAFFRSLFRSHIAREMLTYCHAPVHSCSRLIPCEERALTIRGFSTGQRTHGDVKFFTNGKTVHCPQMTQIWQIYTEDVQHFSQSRWGAAEVIRGAKHILRFISLQVTISHYKSP